MPHLAALATNVPSLVQHPQPQAHAQRPELLEVRMLNESRDPKPLASRREDRTSRPLRSALAAARRKSNGAGPPELRGKLDGYVVPFVEHDHIDRRDPGAHEAETELFLEYGPIDRCGRKLRRQYQLHVMTPSLACVQEPNSLPARGEVKTRQASGAK